MTIAVQKTGNPFLTAESRCVDCGKGTVDGAWLWFCLDCRRPVCVVCEDSHWQAEAARRVT